MKLLAMLLCASLAALAAGPEFTSSGELVRPKDYREWVFLSSGIGMTYSRPVPAGSDPAFDNVFVEPSAYRQFVATGKWPDKTIFILENRKSATVGCLSNDGCRYQSDISGMAAAVKDVSRFKREWGYFSFGPSVNSAKVLASAANCYTCHPQNGAVENTFVQFYPTLLEVARAKGTLKASYLQQQPAAAH
jgi:hypothetical protein